MSDAPFPPSVCGMTLDEIRRALENISGECRSTADRLNPRGADTPYVRSMLEQIADHVEDAHSLVKLLERRRDQTRTGLI